MRTHQIHAAIAVLASLAALPIFAGCEDKKAPAPGPASSTSAAAPKDDHGHEHTPAGGHAGDEHGSSGAGHGGPVITLGEQAIGPFNAKATRDQGEIVAGKDAPIDVTVTPTAGGAAKVVAVRFWIGTEDAKGSVKAKAEVEDPKEPNRWHTHAEIPNPLPAGSKLWVEIEDDKGGTAAGSFDLKM